MKNLRKASHNLIAKTAVNIAADPIIPYMTEAEIGRTIERQRMEMVEAAKRMDFMEAARLRDEIIKLEQLQNELTTKHGND